jgi:hypothetical protein
VICTGTYVIENTPRVVYSETILVLHALSLVLPLRDPITEVTSLQPLLRIRITLMWIWTRLITLMRNRVAILIFI